MTDSLDSQTPELRAINTIRTLSIDAIDKAPNREELSGQTLIVAEIAKELGVTDRGHERPSHRAMLGSPREKNPAAVY